MSKKILITGADGFIGSHLADELVRQGYWGRRFTNNGGQSVSDEFEYNSGDNPWMLTPEEMGEIIRSLEVL